MFLLPGRWSTASGKLPAGHWLEWQDGRIQEDAYWRVPAMEPVPISLEDAKARLDELLSQSISEHMMSDVPLGVWISGGLDSSTILHYAAKATSSKLRTYSISFHGPKLR